MNNSMQLWKVVDLFSYHDSFEKDKQTWQAKEGLSNKAIRGSLWFFPLFLPIFTWLFVTSKCFQLLYFPFYILYFMHNNIKIKNLDNMKREVGLHELPNIMNFLILFETKPKIVDSNFFNKRLCILSFLSVGRDIKVKSF